MSRLFSVPLLLLLAISSCREPDSPQPPPEPIVNYQAYLAPVQEAVFKEDLFNGFLTSPSYWQKDRYAYRFPCFNPADPYEIAYLREDREVTGDCPMALFVFSFHTGKTLQVSNNACYGLDWGSTGWLVYTGIDRKVWKVKANGDSLTQLSFGSGFHNYPIWSPDGSRIVYQHEREIRLIDADGNFVKDAIHWFWPFEWLNDDEIMVGQSPLGGLAAYSWSSDSLAVLYRGGSFRYMSYFDQQSSNVFLDSDTSPHFSKYSLTTNKRDTLRRTYITYGYGLGDFAAQTNKAIIQLGRRDWKDSLANEIYFRAHLLMLDENGEELGIVQLPE
ncbi:MAG: hypothetical protein AAGI38_05220 [Bacteroidota bacterium]